MDAAVIWTIAQKELRDALRNRWFLLYTVAFIALALAFSYLALAGAGIIGLAGFGRTTASLINLTLLIVPLMALSVGAQSVAGERERKTLVYLQSQPIGRHEIFFGKYLGLALSLLASLSLGFGAAGLVMAWYGGGDPAAYLSLVGLAYLLSLAMLGVGLIVSVRATRTSVAIGIGLFLWLLFVFAGDLGMMGTALMLRVPIETLFWLSLINPLQIFKMAAIVQMHATLDILGPAGIFATQRFGAGIAMFFLAALGVWAIIPALIAYFSFQAEGDI
jgi:Cu-processing system permease protein